jgi:hypothetical protein
MSDEAAAEMPKYRSHKTVHAFKIAVVEPQPSGTALITPAETGYARFEVDRAYVQKHSPMPGGYYVVYEDGYKSWSPAAAFESGYTRI